MVQELSITEHRACRYAGLSRTSYREPLMMIEATASLSARIVELAHQRRRFGYRRIHDLLAVKGVQVNHKRVWRLYKLTDLSVRKRRKVKHLTGETSALGE
jgi:putative transposase